MGFSAKHRHECPFIPRLLLIRSPLGTETPCSPTNVTCIGSTPFQHLLGDLAGRREGGGSRGSFSTQRRDAKTGYGLRSRAGVFFAAKYCAERERACFGFFQVTQVIPE